MTKIFLANDHFILRALDRAGITFPIGKQELLSRMGKMEIQVDYDKKQSVSGYMQNVDLDHFETKAQFFCALTGHHAVFKNAHPA
ncbi:hypothetical protein PSQ20_03760 [Curvibacter sp. RS43]|uniref:hypothetical protein n=1 Tax=Curvibacter microcysteis TaxID=3026419 RepID=UPI002362BBD2|nr:hypothetical protein [Curvibacter sp. RS43]MDD0809438.1 hypothetical protein [Curvibacter sp. RS43]